MSPFVQEIINEARPKIVAEAQAEKLLRQIERRFGGLPGDVVERVRSADPERIEVLSDNFATAKTLEDVFAPPRVQ